MIIVIDTETGGVEPGKSALLSISACYFDNPTNTFNVYITPDPSLEINHEAAEVNGYTPQLWVERGAVPLVEALRRFKNWMPRSGNSPLAHNAPFDKSFIDAAEEQSGFKTYLQCRWRCSMSAFMFASDSVGITPIDYKLDTLARMSGHWSADFVRGAHQSIDDVVACAAGYKWLIEKCKKIEIRPDMVEAKHIEERLRLHDELSTMKREKLKADLTMLAAVELLTDQRWAQNFQVSRDEARRAVDFDVATKADKMTRFSTVV